MLEFLHSWAFWMLPLPLLAYLLPAAERQDAALRAPLLNRISALSAEQSMAKPPRRVNAALGVATLSWVALVIAAANPVWFGSPVALPTVGRDLLLAVDISGSMQEADARLGNQRVTRLAAVQYTAGEFIERREGDRIGLILFGDQAYLQTPLTYDRATVATMLNEAVVGLAGQKTAIGDAIGLATKRLETVESEERLLILLTDGENTAGSIDPAKAASLAAALGVKIYTIGFGEAGGGILNRLTSSIDVRSLTDIASATGGRFFRARNTRELEDIYRLIDELEPIEGDAQYVRPRTTLFYWPLTVALLLTILLILARLLSAGAAKRSHRVVSSRPELAS